MSKDQSKSSKSKSTAHAPKKVFDVMRPGKAPASATSRPVIVGHKPQVKEDMFVAGNSKLADNPFDKHDLMSHGKAAAFDARPKSDNKDNAGAATAPTVSDELAPRELDAPTPLVGVDTATTTPDEASSAPVAEDSVSQPASPEPAEIPQRAEEHAPDDPETTNLGLATDTPENTSEDFAKPKEIYEAQVTGAEFSEPASIPPATPQPGSKVLSHDDIVAATGAPMLDHAFVSHHKAHHTKWWEWLLIMLLIIIIGLVALNFLLDAEVISLDLDLPHTNLLK